MPLRSTGRRLARKFQRLAKNGALNSGPVILRWRERSGAGDFDPILDGSNPDFQWAERSETKHPFIHAVTVHTTGYTRFAEVAAGDVILDFPENVQLSGRESLEFDIGGVLYVQKNGGKKLAESWDVRCNGVPITRTVLVTPKS